MTPVRSVERGIERGGLRVELGVEPPIEIDGAEHTALDRRRVSLRWLSGTILTGLAGAALIGASVYAALDPRSMTPEKPEIAVVERSGGRDSAPARKGVEGRAAAAAGKGACCPRGRGCSSTQ